MNVDLSLPLKEDVIKHLSSDASLLDDVPAESFFGINVPANHPWPFVRYGIPIVGGFGATCWEGVNTDISIHIFAESDATMAGEDKALMIAGKVAASLGEFTSPRLAIIENQWTQTTLIKDEPEADRWHAIVAFNIIAVKKDA